MELEELFDYKNQLIKEICSNERIVKLVTNNPNAAVPNHDMPYDQVFPFERVPDTETDGRTFICLDVDIVSVPNSTYYIPVLYVWIFTHESNYRMSEGGVLVDALSAEVNKMLNGSRYYGLGKLKLDSVDRFVPINKFQGRVLTYYAADFNTTADIRRRHPIPSNRKAGA